MPLSTRTAVALGMFSLAAIGVATVFGNTILALVAPAAEISPVGPRQATNTGVPTANAQPAVAPAGGTAPGASAPAVDTVRSGPALATPPSAGAKDASS